MQLVTAEKVAEILAVTKPRVYEMAREGLIPSVRMGRQVRFNEEALRDWIARGGTAQSKGHDVKENKGSEV
jgi:excisionase family DNA binding protein